MAEQKTSKILIKKKKFQSVDIPLIDSKVELVGDSIKDLKDRTINLDLTRQLKGKSVEAIVKIRIENNKAVAYPDKIKLMPYFIRRMIRKRISYIEDSFEAPSQESLIRVKPFLITRKKVSRAVRKALRNRCRNWIEDYVAERKDNEIFNEILMNKTQRTLSLVLKKTYPLSLCEIRILEIARTLKPEEVPKIKEKPEEKLKPEETEGVLGEEILDQMAEIEEEKIKKAKEEIKETQERASEIEKTQESETEAINKEEPEKKPEKKPRKSRKIKEKTKV